MHCALVALVCLVCGAVPCAPSATGRAVVPAGVQPLIKRVTVGYSGEQLSTEPGGAAINGDGSVVVFASCDAALAVAPGYRPVDLYVFHTASGHVERLLNPYGPGRPHERLESSPSGADFPWISWDGRYVVFQSDARNLDIFDYLEFHPPPDQPVPPNPPNDIHKEIFCIDRATGDCRRVTWSMAVGRDTFPVADSWLPFISPDGSTVVYLTEASCLRYAVPIPNDAGRPLAHWDRRTPDEGYPWGGYYLISTPGGIWYRITTNWSGDWAAVCVGPDGVPVPGAHDSNGTFDIVLARLGTDQAWGDFVEMVSFRPGDDPVYGQTASGSSYFPKMSPDEEGRWIVFMSTAPEYAGQQVRGAVAVLYDRLTHRHRVVSKNAFGDVFPVDVVSISANGERVAFLSSSRLADPRLRGAASNLTLAYVWERSSGQVFLASIAHDGSLPNGSCADLHLSGNGRYLLFKSTATNLVPGDTNGVSDWFVIDLNTVPRPSLALWADIDGDGHVGPSDISAFIWAVLDSGHGVDTRVDLNGDGKFDYVDALRFLNCYLAAVGK